MYQQTKKEFNKLIGLNNASASYQSPLIEVVDVKSEIGFAASSWSDGSIYDDYENNMGEF